jgi:N-methylhydantoinase B
MWDRLIAIADDVQLAIVRTAFSSGVREAWDLACILFDASGRSIAQATLSMPAFIGTAPYTIRHMLDRFPADDLAAGDIVVTNDPWMGTGHTPDLCVMRPVFRRDRLVGFVMTISHLPDVGGAGLQIGNREVYEEGLILPVCKLYRAGEPNALLFELIGLNVRVPDLVFGDIAADVLGTATGERLVVEMMDEFGLDDLDALADGTIGQSEAALRAELAKVPDGVYRHSLEVEAVEAPVRLACRIDKRGEVARIDFAGTGPAVPQAINVPLCYTRSFATYAVKCLTIPTVPNNQGALLPLTVEAPAGSILNALRPSPTGGRHTIGWHIVPLIWGALAEAMPERVQADSGMASLSVVNGIRSDGRAVATQYFVAGGLGAMRGLDGHHTTPSPTNNAVVSTEAWESETGMTVLHRRLLADSGGAGRWRGGLGQEVALRNDAGSAIDFSLFGTRSEFAALGVAGGAPGRARRFLVNGKTVSAKGRHRLEPGDVLTIVEAGGGGYGDPRARDPRAVAADLADGFVSAEAARDIYGYRAEVTG